MRSYRTPRRKDGGGWDGRKDERAEVIGVAAQEEWGIYFWRESAERVKKRNFIKHAPCGPRVNRTRKLFLQKCASGPMKNSKYS